MYDISRLRVNPKDDPLSFCNKQPSLPIPFTS